MGPFDSSMKLDRDLKIMGRTEWEWVHLLEGRENGSWAANSSLWSKWRKLSLMHAKKTCNSSCTFLSHPIMTAYLIRERIAISINIVFHTFAMMNSIWIMPSCFLDYNFSSYRYNFFLSKISHKKWKPFSSWRKRKLGSCANSPIVNSTLTLIRCICVPFEDKVHRLAIKIKTPSHHQHYVKDFNGVVNVCSRQTLTEQLVQRQLVDLHSSFM